MMGRGGTVVFAALATTACTEPTYVDVAVGAYHQCALRSDGQVDCWLSPGARPAAELGLRRLEYRRTPSVVPELKDVDDVVAIGRAACAVDKDGVVSCWGDANSVPLMASLGLEDQGHCTGYPEISCDGNCPTSDCTLPWVSEPLEVGDFGRPVLGLLEDGSGICGADESRPELHCLREEGLETSQLSFVVKKQLPGLFLFDNGTVGGPGTVVVALERPALDILNLMTGPPLSFVALLDDGRVGAHGYRLDESDDTVDRSSCVEAALFDYVVCELPFNGTASSRLVEFLGDVCLVTGREVECRKGTTTPVGLQGVAGSFKPRVENDTGGVGCAVGLDGNVTCWTVDADGAFGVHSWTAK